jgi:hypothetical protein
MQDRKGSDSGYLVPGTWYLTPVSHSHISNLNRALGIRYQVPGVPGSRFRVPGTWDPRPGTESAPRAGYRAPRTEVGDPSVIR